MPVQVHAAARADLSPFSHAEPKARVHRRFLLPGATGARVRWEGARPRSKQPLDPKAVNPSRKPFENYIVDIVTSLVILWQIYLQQKHFPQHFATMSYISFR